MDIDFPCYADTVCWHWPCSHLVDLEDFFDRVTEGGKLVVMLQTVAGKWVKTWEKPRVEHRFSWWGKMMISVEHECVGRAFTAAARDRKVVSLTYSVAKWYNKTSGYNYGTLDFDFLIQPAIDALRFLGLTEPYIESFRTNAILRRIDLSCNWKLGDAMLVSDFMRLLSRISFNRTDVAIVAKDDARDIDFAIPGGRFESLTWGSRGSNYRVVCYDKWAEQKHFFLEESYKEPADIREERIKFWKEELSESLKNVVRFECQFKSKFFHSIMNPQTKERGDYKNPRGKEMINNVIDIASNKYAQLARRAFGNFGLENIKDLGDKVKLQEVQDRLEKWISPNGRTLGSAYCDGLWKFAHDCEIEGWKAVRARKKATEFHNYRKRLIEIANYDVKIASPSLTDYSRPKVQKEGTTEQVIVELRPIISIM